MKRSVIVFIGLVIFLGKSFSQNLYPSHWWVGMQNPKLQILIHSTDIKNGSRVIMEAYPGVKLISTKTLESNNYLVINVEINKTAKPGKLVFRCTSADKLISTITYELKTKSNGDGKTRIQGVTQADLIYLLMPDRFANGDASNDYFIDMRDTAHDRANPFDRHGGDLQGIEDHLDYLKELGVTTIWPTPVVENDMARTIEGGTSRSTYHGYAFTDQYKIDKRFGGNEVYKKVVNAAHAKGLKFIQDAVYNHVGRDHWSMIDMPMKDWVNQWPTYTNTSYKEMPLVDPYASEMDKKVSLDGWFTPFLADLNQRNPYVANFLIQYAVWATEEFGIDGWRVDTYFYNDPAFLNKINDALFKEFPKLTLFGETLVPSVIDAAYFGQNNFANVPFRHNTPGVTDMPLTNAFLDALKKPFGSNDVVYKVYTTLAEDIVYKDASRNCIFLDNHDLDRVYSVIGEDFDKYKMSINWLLTLRGIPQLYYGTEILMKNMKVPTDAEVRRDFPGGWKDDAVNKFTKEGRTQQEQEAFVYVSALAKFRKSSSAIAKGKLMQYTPKDGLYIYFRYDDKQTVMVISNAGKNAVKPDWKFYGERADGYGKIKNVITGEVRSLIDFEIQPKESFVFELVK